MISKTSAILFASALGFSVTNAVEWRVRVGVDPTGAQALSYTPAQVEGAVPGDTVKFEFEKGTHTVTQSSFEKPCEKLNATALASGQRAAGSDPFTVSVNDTKPVWFYCGVADHCQSGMVFALNPTAEKTFDLFQKIAQGEISPGDPDESSTDTDSTTDTNTETTTTDPSKPTDGEDLSTGTDGLPLYPTSFPVITVTLTLSDNELSTTTYESHPSSPDPTTAPGGPKVHVVQVGLNATGPALTFNPPKVQAAINDTISFEFHAKNHTATQSSFNQPCVPSENGIDSGFQFVAPDATEFPIWNVTVNDTAPIWFFCKQPVGQHCANGMVFAVNALDKELSYDVFRERALLQANNNPNSTSTSSGSDPTDTTSKPGDASKTVISTFLALVFAFVGMVALA